MFLLSGLLPGFRQRARFLPGLLSVGSRFTVMETGNAGKLILVRNQVKKWAEGLSARQHLGHRLKTVVLTHLSPPGNQELC